MKDEHADNEKEIEDRCLELMCGGILVFPFQELTIAKRKLTNGKQFQNTAGSRSTTLWEIH